MINFMYNYNAFATTAFWISSKIALDELDDDLKPSCQNKIGQHPGAGRIPGFPAKFLFPGFGGKNQGH